MKLLEDPTFEEKIAYVIYTCWTKTVTVKSDFAREYAPEIAACASEGYITTRVFPEVYIQQWVVTPEGLERYQDEQGELIF